jgi:hypothetical protein
MGIISALNEKLFKAPLKICGKCNYFFEKEELKNGTQMTLILYEIMILQGSMEYASIKKRNHI